LGRRRRRHTAGRRLPHPVLVIIASAGRRGISIRSRISIRVSIRSVSIRVYTEPKAEANAWTVISRANVAAMHSRRGINVAAAKSASTGGKSRRCTERCNQNQRSNLFGDAQKSFFHSYLQISLAIA
jgi:hypothetical protein